MTRIALLLYLLSCCVVAEQLQPVTFLSSSAEDDPVLLEQQVFQMLLTDIDNAHIANQRVGINRALKMMQADTPICVRNLVKTPEREQLYLYSLPQTFFPGLKLFYRPGSLHGTALQQENHYSLQQLLIINPKLRIGVEAERSYSEQVDQLLLALPEHRKIYKHGMEDESAMINMLLSGRFDILIEYEAVVRVNKQRDQLDSSWFSEAPSVVTGHIVCNKQPASYAIMAQLNRALAKLYQSDHYIELHRHYLSDEEQQLFLANLKQTKALASRLTSTEY